ncbi:MAG: PSD1 and planctomycete cytochrome C domain-containing protein [Verrucomicrobiales bacterium]
MFEKESLILACLVATAATADAAVDFEADIKPLLENKCLSCHNPNNSKGKISLHSAESVINHPDRLVVPNQPEDSLLLEVIAPGSDGADAEMPDEGEALSSEEVDQVREWIAAGASWPDGLVLKEASKASRDWWAYQALRTPQLSTIDAFIGARLAEQGLAFNPTADRRTLLRRATYDLTGLPPTPDQVAAFIADQRPDAYARMIDRLLASPRYGERWGRHWLDVVRFGESNGFERNIIIPNLWPFRDYVIKSINDDKPFDQLIREHLAGDVLGAGDPEVAIGSAFLVAGPYDNVGNQDAVAAAQIRADTIDEMIRATSESFLGLTLGCARCHDHKFDPIKSEDYYGLYATFAGVRHGEATLASERQQTDRTARLKPLKRRRAELLELQKSAAAAAEKESLKAQIAAIDAEIKAIPPLPKAWVGTRTPAPGPFAVFLGGSPQRKGGEALPASLSPLDGQVAPYRLPNDSPESERRVRLAGWITDPDNPLPPRVLANRLWQHHFGIGIVDTPNDFGYMGGRPSHPELLDFLAVKLKQNGWRLKAMHRLIMNSRTYQQSSQWDQAAADIDSGNRLLWRFSPRRLSAEEVRDTLLSISGKLDLDQTGGPGFRLYEYQQDNVATYVPLDRHGPETYRRAIYHQNARASVIDLMTDFDQPDCAFSVPRRVATTTPLQALTMLNHSFGLDMAEALAARVRGDGDAGAQVAAVFEFAYQRQPEPEETSRAVAAVQAHGLRAFCRAILNSSELIYLD